MLTFFGKNDASTLQGILDEIKTELRYANLGMQCGKTRRERDRYDGERIALERIQWRLERAIESGPYRPSSFKISIPDEARKRLAFYIEQGTKNKEAAHE